MGATAAAGDAAHVGRYQSWSHYGAEGPRLYHWAALELPTVAEFDYQGEVPVRRRWALARRSLSKPGEIAYFLAYCPWETVVADLVRIAGMRWQIEMCQPQCTHKWELAV
ncbi:hypothetical protein ACFQ0G_42895 [Streptomyces chiangmaiensis]